MVLPDFEQIVSDVRKLRSIQPGRKINYPDSLKRRIARLVAQGMLVKDISQATGVSRGAIAKWVSLLRSENDISATDLVHLPDPKIAKKIEVEQGPLVSIQLVSLKFEVPSEDFKSTLVDALQAAGGLV